MTEMGQDIFSLAAMTTAVGMGVVFAALVLLACYMIIFKRLTTHLEEKGRRAAAPPEAEAEEAPQISSAATVDAPAADLTIPQAADPVEAELAVAMAAAAAYCGLCSADAEMEAVAALTGVALYLEGVESAYQPAQAGPDVIAAIMTALHTHFGGNLGQVHITTSGGMAVAPATLSQAAPAAPRAVAATGGWKVSGWLEAQGSRMQLQGQPRRVVPVAKASNM